MWSVPSRFSDPSTAVRMFAGLLSSTSGPAPECETKPNLVASTISSRRPLDRPADELLVREGPVDLGGVDVGDAQVERPLDGADRLGLVAARAGVVGGHPHGAESDAGHIESAERDVLHERGSVLLSHGHTKPRIATRVGVPVETGSDRTPQGPFRRRTVMVVDNRSEIREF